MRYFNLTHLLLLKLLLWKYIIIQHVKGNKTYRTQQQPCTYSNHCYYSREVELYHVSDISTKPCNRYKETDEKIG